MISVSSPFSRSLCIEEGSSECVNSRIFHLLGIKDVKSCIFFRCTISILLFLCGGMYGMNTFLSVKKIHALVVFLSMRCHSCLGVYNGLRYNLPLEWEVL